MILLVLLLTASVAVNIVLALNLRGNGSGDAVKETSETTTAFDPGNAQTGTVTGEPQIGEEIPVEDCFAISTAYCNFYLPNEYKDKIVGEPNGFTVPFYGIIGGEKYPLYTVYFNKETDEKLGTVTDAEGNKIDVYFEYEKNYKEFYDKFDQAQKDEYGAMTETYNVLVNQFMNLPNYVKP